MLGAYRIAEPSTRGVLYVVDERGEFPVWCFAVQVAIARWDLLPGNPSSERAGGNPQEISGLSSREDVIPRVFLGWQEPKGLGGLGGLLCRLCHSVCGWSRGVCGWSARHARDLTVPCAYRALGRSGGVLFRLDHVF